MIPRARSPRGLGQVASFVQLTGHAGVSTGEASAAVRCMGYPAILELIASELN
jgi:hypothetical protein